MHPIRLMTFCLPVMLIFQCNTAENQVLKFDQLQQPVEIITDRWGVPHIYAQNEQDLFFAQGYQAAKDRLFQFEMFRRRATGTIAEVLGKRELNRDIGARLFRFRGDMDEELSHYHPRGKSIIKSFVNGINAYITQVLEGKMPMPYELKMLGINPGFWTSEVVVSRHNGLLENVIDELKTARLILKVGEETVRTISDFQPSPNLNIDPVLDSIRLFDDILELYYEYRTSVMFKPEDLVSGKNIISNESPVSFLNKEEYLHGVKEGSNNWVIDGKKSASGFPLLANDPHRVITVPSLRYLVHLSAPGWNVIGAGEPVLPGVSIGHNDYGAWGLTVFETDVEDLYVYRLNPENPHQYFYKGEWKKFNILTDTIKVKNEADTIVKLYYSVHGPVTYIDSTHLIAYAIKCGWLEKGCAPYLASLRMNQARSWEEFRDACSYSYIPAENMVWADRNGNIGWQVVGLAPIRNHNSGLVPVPGDGRYEWDGYLPVLQRPSLYNPANGFITTANEYNTPADYPFMNSIGFDWTASFRRDRIKEILEKNKKITIDEMQHLQSEYLSLPARKLIPLLQNIPATNSRVQLAKQIFKGWDFYLSPSSVAASVYTQWEAWLELYCQKKLMLDTIQDLPVFFSTPKIIKYLSEPGNKLIQSNGERDELLIQSLQSAIMGLENYFGSDTSQWRYGQEKMKHILIRHPLSFDEKKSKLLNVGPAPRGGNGNTVNNTGDNLNQVFGASFRLIVDCADWDQAKAINTPGQSGDPYSKHYQDLFPMWVENNYFPLYFSESKVKSAGETVLRLLPE